MSNHHAKPKRPVKRFLRPPWVVSLALLICAMAAFPVFYQWWRWNSAPQADWPSVGARVLETRIVVVDVINHAYRGGEIDYRAEAHVAYDLDGVHHDEWLPASDVYSDKLSLQFLLWQKRNKLCTVLINPKNAKDKIVVLT